MAEEQSGSPATDNGECVHLSEREHEVCTILCASEVPVTFGAMKEELHLHQEKLSRVLKRLTFYGCADKTPTGWVSFCRP